MNRVFNFSAGPSTLPLATLEQARDEFVDYQGAGMSIIEMSHRSKPYDAVHQGATGLLRELLQVPDNFKILFLQGGATLQFSMIPLNFLSGGKSCDFTITGTWAKKAYADAKKIGDVHVLYDGKDANYLALPDPRTLQVNADAAYLHMTSNETIGGIQWQEFPETGNVPIVCDMSSDILSRPLDWSKFGLVYAGAQKNVGPAGMGIVFIRDDMLERAPESITAYLDYRIHASKDSLYNTPPVFCIYMVNLVLQHLKAAGGVEGAQRLAAERSGLLYDAINAHGDFYSSPVPESCRSKMNVVFRLPTEELEAKFVAEALALGLSGLKGHRSVGGCRASIYNAMPVAGVEKLVAFMDSFAKANV